MAGVKVPAHFAISALDARPIVVEVASLCGSEVVTLEPIPREATTAVRLARVTQLVASIQHVVRYECHRCHELFYHALTPTEKQFLYYTNPKLGKALGLVGVNPETLGT